MSQEIIVQFVGFEAGALARVYSFTVREPSVTSSELGVVVGGTVR